MDPSIEALYICTNGGLCTSTKQLIMERVKSLAIPVHVAYVGASCSASESAYLEELTRSSGGRFHVSPLTGNLSGHYAVLGYEFCEAILYILRFRITILTGGISITKDFLSLICLII